MANGEQRIGCSMTPLKKRDENHPVGDLTGTKADLFLIVDRASSLTVSSDLVRGALRTQRIGQVVVLGDVSEELGSALKDKGVTIDWERRPLGQSLARWASASSANFIILQDAAEGYSPQSYPELLAPLENRQGDVVYGVRHDRRTGMRISGRCGGVGDRAMNLLTSVLTNMTLDDPGTGMRAFLRDVLDGLALRGEKDGIDVEIAVKLSARLFRMHEVAIPFDAACISAASSRTREALSGRLSSLAKYALWANDADNERDGYNTLARMESCAAHYNAWLGRRISAHLGRRVLEVGAGIGTITREISQGRELVIALEIERFYYERLVNLFASSPNVRPVLSGVEAADWESFASDNLDTVVLSNVLEHIEDDRQALINFRKILKKGGRVVCLAPAIPALFGTMDRAVGHFRRYSQDNLRNLFQQTGFEVRVMEPMNVLGIPGWFVNGKILKRDSVPPFQLRAFDLVAPLVAGIESKFHPPIGMSLLAVGEAT